MEKHYDEAYFFMERHGGKRYVDSAGEQKEFGYSHGGQWNFQGILDKLIELLGLPESILDLGAGCGGFVATANNNGIKSLGLEFSQFAIDHAILGAEKYLKCCDLAETPWSVKEQYNWVTAIDLFEHVFVEDVDAIIKETKEHARKYIIAKICTAQHERELWNAKKAPYEQVIAQAKNEGFEWLVVSGHVTCQWPSWWINKFVDSEWLLRSDLAEKLKKDLRLPEDWRTTIILENVSQRKADVVSPLPKLFTSDYYDEAYFAKAKGKKYRRTSRLLDGWSYANPTGEFLGCKDIAKAWKKMFSPERMLDVGCGRGTFVAYARDEGIKAEGFDYSKYAIDNPYFRCKPEWLKVHDAMSHWSYPDCSFDLVTVLDFLEHVYREDLGFVIQELYRVAWKWVFIQVAIPEGSELPTGYENGYILDKGKPVPLELEKYAVAGHVTLIDEMAWEELLDNPQWMRRRDLEAGFKAMVPSGAIKNWLANLIMVYEMVE